MKTAFRIILIIVALFVLASCAPGPNELMNSANAKGTIPGFWQGVWNGIISPITFIISLFNKNTQMYEVHNNGGWYNFGFLLGVSMIFGGGAGGAASSRRRQ
jgi:hypothetical protein